MRLTVLIPTVLTLMTAICTFADGTVSVIVDSPNSGLIYAPGKTIDWDISFVVTGEDNFGLALLSCDLMQDPNNPELFDLPPGDESSIPMEMDDFTRPDGISNPGEGGATTGYIGVQRGTAGQMNLVQLGGAQNTFGEVGPAGLGQDFTADGGVGQSGLQLLVSGSFVTPSADGVYVFEIKNCFANTLDEVNSPPNVSMVSSAIVLFNSSFSIEVAPLADMNCDGAVNGADIDPFFQALGDPVAYQAAHPRCDLLQGDIDGDGQLTGADIDPFFICVGLGGCP